MKAAARAVIPLGVVVAAGPLLAAIGSSGQWKPACLATAVCLMAALPSYWLAVAVWQRCPDYGPAAIAAGTAVRLGLTLGAVLALSDRLAAWGIERTRFATWVAFQYVATLVVECVLLIRQVSATGRASGSRELTEPP